MDDPLWKESLNPEYFVCFMKVVSLAGDWRGSVWEDAAGGPAGDAEATNHLRKKRFKKIQIIFLTEAKNKIQFKKSSDNISYWGNKTLLKFFFSLTKLDHSRATKEF